MMGQGYEQDSGYRDMAYSDWHRMLREPSVRSDMIEIEKGVFKPVHEIGKGLPMTDIDSVEVRRGNGLESVSDPWLEYRGDGVVAIIETKRGSAQRRPKQLDMLAALANRARLPAFMVNYDYTPKVSAGHTYAGNLVDWGDWQSWMFKVKALNEYAMPFMGRYGQQSPWVPQDQYIRFLSRL